MKELKELVRMTRPGRIGKINLLQDENLKEDFLYADLFNGIAEGTVNTDRDAKKLLYGGKVSGNKYYLLKQRLTDRIYDTLLFLEPRDKSSKSYQFNAYYCMKHLVVAKLLLTITANYSGRKLLEKVLKRALQYEFYDVIQQCAIMLKREALLMGENKQYDYYHSLFIEAHEKIAAEARAEELYHLLIKNFATTYENRPQLAEVANEYVQKMEKLQEEHKSYNIFYYYSNVKLLYYELINDYESALGVCKMFEDFLLKNTEFYTVGRHTSYLLKMCHCYLHLREFDKGMHVAERAEKMFTGGTENWFILQELHFTLALNLRRFDKACKIYLSVTGHERFEMIRQRQQEIWKIFGGYLWFMLKHAGEEDLLAGTFASRNEYRVHKLMNDVPIFSKDKKGINVAILILHVLILTQQGDYVTVISRTEALKYYMYRNVRKDDSSRSHYFIKLLLAMDKANFNPQQLRKKAAKLMEKLRAEKINYQPTQTRIEIISYEELWEIIMEMLEERSEPKRQMA